MTSEEMTTILTQIEACLNGCPLVALGKNDDGIEALTSGHFLVARLLQALPNPSESFHPISVLRC